ncbi:MAG: energy transducer TonB [Candidatus Methylomirabilales bacterium]
MSPRPQGLQETNKPESASPQPSFRDQIASLGRETLSGKDRAFDAGQTGNTGTDERTVSLETHSSEFAPYLATVKRRIERRWLVPRFAREVGLTAKLVMLFSITKEGKLARIQVNKSSGVPILDDAAVEAVKTAAPYSPFPSHFTFRRLNIVATFEYVTRPPRSATPPAPGRR